PPPETFILDKSAELCSSRITSMEGYNAAALQAANTPAAPPPITMNRIIPIEKFSRILENQRYDSGGQAPANSFHSPQKIKNEKNSDFNPFTNRIHSFYLCPIRHGILYC